MTEKPRTFSSEDAETYVPLFHAIHQLEQCAAELFETHVGTRKLTARQYVVLCQIEQNQGISQTQIVNQTGIDRSTIAEIMRRLTTRGYLARARTKQDARRYEIHLTDAGRKLLEDVTSQTRRVDTDILAAIPTEHRDTFKKILTTAITALGSNK